MAEVGFSIITVTNRKYCINNLLKNYYNQLFNKKELIIIINSDDFNLDDFCLFNNDPNIYIFNKPTDITLGECLNFAIDKCNYNFIAKFDDDDYYGPYYIEEAFNLFISDNYDVIGKQKTYYYIEKYNQLLLKNIGKENEYTSSIMGSTICFKKNVYDKVKFRHISCREDYYFNRECLNNGYKIFSSSCLNHIVFKHSNPNNHTFVSDINGLMILCKIIKSDVSFEMCFDLVNFKK